MSLIGSLYSAVSGVKAQGTSLAVISDNISNVNTVGYKASEATFQTLVNNSPASVSYNPGGVRADSRQFVSKQGLLNTTDSPTDIALQGKGMFVVSNRPDSQASDAQTLYTRAGSFRFDATGNLVNTQGFYLQGWPLDREGRLPGQPGNLNTIPFSTTQSLETVNIEFGNGVAASTSKIDVGTNLDARQEIARGAGKVISFGNAFNSGVAADDPITPVAGLANGQVLKVSTQNGLQYDYEYGGFEQSNAITGGITISPGGNTITTTTETFFTNASAPAAGADSQFTINVNGAIYTFQYTQSGPNPLATPVPQFNNMQTLAAAINSVADLNARIVDDRLIIAPQDANVAMTFNNSGATDFVGDLGLANTTAATTSQRFATLRDLFNKINDSEGLTATLDNATADAQLGIYTSDPLESITFTATDSLAVDSTAATIGELGLWEDTDADLTFDVGNENVFARLYDPVNGNLVTTDGNKNMSDGGVTPHFSRNVRVFDALGQGHNLTVSYLKIGENRWAVEIYSPDDGDVQNALPGTVRQLAQGEITFNGDGSLRSVSTGLSNPINVNWTNGASASAIEINWGNAGFAAGTPGATEFGDTSGLSQFAADFKVAFNGAEVGSLISVTVDADGFVIANYSNGDNQKIYKIPVADFANENGLENRSGNVWFTSQEAGALNLREASTNGVGKIVSGVIEASNVELSEELTDMIVTQRAYQSNTKVISTSDELLEELTRL